MSIFKEESNYFKKDIFMDIISKDNVLKFSIEGNSVKIPFTVESPKIELI